MRSFGMTPVFPAFAGFVPAALAAQRPDLNIARQGITRSPCFPFPRLDVSLFMASWPRHHNFPGCLYLTASRVRPAAELIQIAGKLLDEGHQASSCRRKC